MCKRMFTTEKENLNIYIYITEMLISLSYIALSFYLMITNLFNNQ